MNKTDYEVLLQYVEETDKEFYESLSTQKQIMYLCYQYETVSFKKYLFKYKNIFVEIDKVIIDRYQAT